MLTIVVGVESTVLAVLHTLDRSISTAMQTTDPHNATNSRRMVTLLLSLRSCLSNITIADHALFAAPLGAAVDAVATALSEASPSGSTIVVPPAMESIYQPTLATSTGLGSSHSTTLSHTQLPHTDTTNNHNPTLDAAKELMAILFPRSVSPMPASPNSALPLDRTAPPPETTLAEIVLSKASYNMVATLDSRAEIHGSTGAITTPHSTDCMAHGLLATYIPQLRHQVNYLQRSLPTSHCCHPV